MTIINSIEIDNINYIKNDLQDAIRNNKPLEEKLNVIIVCSNPCQYATRYILAREFIARIENDEKNVNLYIVELAYKLPNNKVQKFHITDSNNKNHLQLTTDIAPLWVKENLQNIAVEKLLGGRNGNWKSVAFCDADISFDNVHWATDTLKVLNKTRDIVHMHSHCLDLDSQNDPMSIFSSFGYQYSQNRQYSKGGIHFWHPGFNVAMTKSAYYQLNGLYDLSILGSGDHNFMFSLIQNGIKSVNKYTSDGYKKSITEYEQNFKDLKFGVINGVIRHYFHGSKKNRKYMERWEILVKHQYDPYTMITKDSNGLVKPTENCPQELLHDIYNYFKERNEDENRLENGVTIDESLKNLII